jgi:hypothetical protein
MERLRQFPELTTSAHVTKSHQQIQKNDHFVAAALRRFGIENLPRKAAGRRASNLFGWLEPLFAWLDTRGFIAASPTDQNELLSVVGEVAAARVRTILAARPLIARLNKGTAVAVIADLLDQAQTKKVAKDVAEYLVGAKLQLRFGPDAVTPSNVNTPNRLELADFRFRNAAFEVTVSSGDDPHLNQVREILNDTRLEVWLLVRRTDRDKWQKRVNKGIGEHLLGRVAVTDVESFVGQNVAELGLFESLSTSSRLDDLFRRYNEHWLPAAGSEGLRIVSRDPDEDDSADEQSIVA